MDFEGKYPIEGAKEVKTLMTRYVTRAIRTWTMQMESKATRSAYIKGTPETALHLEIAAGSKALRLVRVQGAES